MQRWLILVLAVSGLAPAACRWNYELGSENSVGLGGEGAFGSGSGSSGGTGPSDGGSGAGATTGGGGVTSGGGTGSGGSGTGGSGTGGSGTGGSGTGGTLPTADFAVTTPLDEEDGDEPGAPLGDGFSLREAIIYSNSEPGTQVISLAGITSVLTKGLTNITAPVILIGEGGGVDASGAGNNHTFYVNAPDVQIIDVDIINAGRAPVFFLDIATGGVFRESTVTNPSDPTYVQGDGIFIGYNEYTGCQSDCLVLMGNDNEVRGNRFVDSANDGIRVAPGAMDSLLVGNTVIRPDVGIAVNTSAARTKIWNNTVVSAIRWGMTAFGAVETDIRNNLIADCGEEAVGAEDTNLAHFDYLLSFQNLGLCTGCTTLPGPNLWEVDPQFVNFGADNVSIETTSPAVNVGFDLGEPFLGSAPDLGANEVN